MVEKNYLFKIDVTLDEINEVRGGHASACMILFHGRMDSNFFHGEILPGGVDTQIVSGEGRKNLSARYIIRGIDAKGDTCNIFVENNGSVNGDNEIITKPRFITDSPLLKWLEEDVYIGKIYGKSEIEIEIRIYRE
ncbi:DUF3237 family protein [Butyrivibrio sp. AE3004]|uniref:DUF3237 family protein n=1 Tax=Butyrivibrio sp. AE3004 TaxID=1506994 RepID=UPI000494331D|nr:DUF3237 family protein [Butyrivibrio sp. AE3004]